MGCHEKFCIIRRPDGQKHYYGVVIRKLLYTTMNFSSDEWSCVSATCKRRFSRANGMWQSYLYAVATTKTCRCRIMINCSLDYCQTARTISAFPYRTYATTVGLGYKYNVEMVFSGQMNTITDSRYIRSTDCMHVALANLPFEITTVRDGVLSLPIHGFRVIL